MSMVPVKSIDVDQYSPKKKFVGHKGFILIPGAHHRRRLRGYETLQELRDKAASFRQGYLNWRKSKARGAKGEANDLFTGRKAQETPANLEISILEKEAFKIIKSIKQLKDESSNSLTSLTCSTYAQDQNVPPEETKQFVRSLRYRRRRNLFEKYKLRDGSLDAHDTIKTIEDEDEWLRFYYNPFTPATSISATPVKTSTLPILASRGIQIPRYNRSSKSVTHWILHIGVGQFHRAHQLVFLDDVLSLDCNKPKSTSQCYTSIQTSSQKVTRHTSAKWGYCGVGLMPFDDKMANALRQQDLLFTVMSRTNASSSVRIVGSMVEYIFAYEEPEQAFKKLIDPNLHIISLTITEKGYCQNVNGSLDIANKYVQHDLDLFKNKVMKKIDTSPQTALGFLYWGLRERFKRGIPPFTVMSCDNLPENGYVARNMLQAFANCVDPEFAKWIGDTVKFPCSMVDRITPATVLEHREILAKDYGVIDEWPVVTEEFSQWAIEDNFTCRPPWENVGVMLVSDVRPLELMKLRLLNGGHSMIGYISYLAGYHFVDDALNNVQISSFLRAYMDEVTSTIRNVSIELERYKEKIVERFGNCMIKDKLLRLCEDGSTKLYNTTKDALIELVKEDRHIHCTALGLAGFILFLATCPVENILDAKKTLIIQLAKNVVENTPSTLHTAEFLKNIYGSLLGQSPCLVNQTCLALLALKVCSVKRVLECGGTLEALFDQHTTSSELFQNFLDFLKTTPIVKENTVAS